jgi:hypothetical protein
MESRMNTFRPFRLLSRALQARAAGVVLFAGALLPVVSQADTRLDEATATAAQIKTQRVVVKRSTSVSTAAHGLQPRGPGCGPVVVSLASGFDTLDVGSQVTLQAGMVEQEGFGQTYIVPDPDPTTPQNEAFPITINLVEFIVATVGTTSGSDGQPIIAGYTVEIYDGDPVPGNPPVFSASSTNDQTNNPDLPEDASLQRVSGSTCQPCASSNLSASVAKVQFSVDPSDGDHIIVPGNDQSGGIATGRFTVIVRITRMNDTTPYTACSFGLSNDCGPLNRCNNAFMCTESNSSGALNYPSRDWLVSRDCGAFSCAPGTFEFSQLSAQGGVSDACRPSRDPLIQTTYTPAICSVAAEGACCATSGACSIAAAGACTAVGAYQGNGSVCGPNPCPQPSSGACCTNGSCSLTNDSGCTSGGGVFQGSGTTCSGVSCPSAGGACCGTIAGTPFCATGTAAECASIPGVYQGNGTTCVPGSPFDACGTGACCSTAGACTAGLTAAQCTSQQGTYQGNGFACSPTLCPVATGACCLSSGACLVRTPSQCAGIPGSVFHAAATPCSPNVCPQSGVCCIGSTCAVGITQAGCTATAPVGAFFVAAGTACNAGGANTAPCCYADFNKVGGLSVQDIFDYLAAWFAGSPYCQVGGNGATTPNVQDIFTFLSVWFSGC